MKVDDRAEVLKIRAQAQRWYEEQIEVSAKRLGPAWPALEAWVREYLKFELRERLIARGWRPRNGH